MIVYAVQLYTVDAAHRPEFLAAFRPRGLWSDIARLQPGHIHTDLLRNPSDSSKFLAIDFWTSIRALFAARRSPEVRRFFRWLQRQGVDREGIGMFVFPPLPAAGEPAGNELDTVSDFIVVNGHGPQGTESEVRP